jgi:hypothetical protein
METFLILLFFVGGPIAIAALITVGVAHRVKTQRTIAQAAEKYLHS